MSNPCEFSAELISMMYDFYDYIDDDGSGELDAHEFLECMKKFGKVRIYYSAT